jgi:hypothetical protein
MKLLQQRNTGQRLVHRLQPHQTFQALTTEDDHCILDLDSRELMECSEIDKLVATAVAYWKMLKLVATAVAYWKMLAKHSLVLNPVPEMKYARLLQKGGIDYNNWLHCLNAKQYLSPLVTGAHDTDFHAWQHGSSDPSPLQPHNCVYEQCKNIHT